jgi:hypothetical protein
MTEKIKYSSLLVDISRLLGHIDYSIDAMYVTEDLSMFYQMFNSRYCEDDRIVSLLNDLGISGKVIELIVRPGPLDHSSKFILMVASFNLFSYIHRGYL